MPTYFRREPGIEPPTATAASHFLLLNCRHGRACRRPSSLSAIASKARTRHIARAMRRRFADDADDAPSDAPIKHQDFARSARGARRVAGRRSPARGADDCDAALSGAARRRHHRRRLFADPQRMRSGAADAQLSPAKGAQLALPVVDAQGQAAFVFRVAAGRATGGGAVRHSAAACRGHPARA